MGNQINIDKRNYKSFNDYFDAYTAAKFGRGDARVNGVVGNASEEYKDINPKSYKSFNDYFDAYTAAKFGRGYNNVSDNNDVLKNEITANKSAANTAPERVGLNKTTYGSSFAGTNQNESGKPKTVGFQDFASSLTKYAMEKAMDNEYLREMENRLEEVNKSLEKAKTYSRMWRGDMTGVGDLEDKKNQLESKISKIRELREANKNAEYESEFSQKYNFDTVEETEEALKNLENSSAFYITKGRSGSNIDSIVDFDLTPNEKKEKEKREEEKKYLKNYAVNQGYSSPAEYEKLIAKNNEEFSQKIEQNEALYEAINNIIQTGALSNDNLAGPLNGFGKNLVPKERNFPKEENVKSVSMNTPNKDEVAAEIEDLKKEWETENNKLYDAMVKNAVPEESEDFEEYSKVDTSKSYKNNAGIKGSSQTDYDYNYINNIDNFRKSEINPVYLNKNINYKSLTDDEIKRYNYYYNKYGKDVAGKYLDTLNLSERAGKSLNESNDSTVGKIVLKGAAGYLNFGEGMVKNFAGEDFKSGPIQSASDYASYDLMNRGSLARVAGDVSYLVGNMAPSILLSHVAGVAGASAKTAAALGNISMSSASSGDAYADAKSKGYSDGQARLYSVFVGASEGGLQYALGGISALGGKATGDVIAKKIAGIDNAFLHAAATLGTSMASEGLEEGLQEFLEPVISTLVLNEKYDPAKAEEVMYAALLGALSAGMFETKGVVSYERQASAAGKVVRRRTAAGEKTAADAIIEAGLALDEDSTGYKISQNVKEKLDAGEKINPALIGRIVVEGGDPILRAVNEWDAQNLESVIAKDFEAKEGSIERMAAEEAKKRSVAENLDLDKYNEIKQRLTAEREEWLKKDKAEIEAVISRGLSMDENTPEHMAALEARSRIENGGYVAEGDLMAMIDNYADKYDADSAEDFDGYDGGEELPDGAYDALKLSKALSNNGDPVIKRKIETADRLAAAFKDSGRDVDVLYYKKEASGDGTIENGYFDPDTGVIRINLLSKNYVGTTFGHELTHALEKATTSGESSYGKLTQLVAEKLGRDGTSLNDEATKVIERYAVSGKTLEMEAARREVVAEYVSEKLFSDEASIRELARTQKSLAERVLNWINDVIRRFKGEGAEVSFLREAQKLYRKALDEAGNAGEDSRISRELLAARAKFNEALERDPYIRDINARLDNGSITEEQHKRSYDYYMEHNVRFRNLLDNLARAETKSNGTDVNTEQVANDSRKYSIKRDENGKSVVVIDTDQNLFNGQSKEKYPQIAKRILNEKFRNETIPLSEYGLVYVDKTGINKYLYSGKKTSSDIFEAKMRASTELNNLLEVSEYVGHSEDVKSHSFAEFGFDYYKTTFFVDGKKFEGVFDIGVSESGCKFYGFTNIERAAFDSGKYSDRLSVYTSESNSKGDSDNVSISQDATAVNTEKTEKVGKLFAQNGLQLPTPLKLSDFSSNIISSSGEGVNNNSTDNSRKYSISYTEDGEPFVTVEEDILKGVPKKEWASVVKNVIKEKFPDGVAVGNNVIKINQKTRNEYTNSKYSRWLEKNKTDSIYRDKMRAANNLDEIVKASGNYVNESLKHARKDNFTDFGHGEVLMRIGDNSYTADVVVGYTAGNNMILYDIINLKHTDKIKSQAEDSIRIANNSFPDRNTSPDNVSISPSGEDVNTKFKENSKKYSISYTENGEPFVTVEEDVLEDVPKKEWASVVKQVIKEKFPNGVAVGNNVIKINKRTRNEYTHSKYSRWLEKNYNSKSNTTYRDKMKAAGNLDEIVAASKNYVNEAPNHARKDSFTDFGRGEVLIRIGENNYIADVIVGHNNENDMVLYDVINMRHTDKIKSQAEDNTGYAYDNKRADRNTSPDNVSISPSGEDVNAKFKENPGHSSKKFSISETGAKRPLTFEEKITNREIENASKIWDRMDTRAKTFVARNRRRAVNSISESLSLQGEAKKILADEIHKIAAHHMNTGEVFNDAMLRDSFDKAYGARGTAESEAALDAETKKFYRQCAWNDFRSAVYDMSPAIALARRYTSEAIARTEERRKTGEISIEEYKNTFDEFPALIREKERAARTTLLTAGDAMVLGKLLRGETTTEFVAADEENAAAIIRMYEATRPLEDAKKLIQDYGKQTVRKYQSLAKSLLGSASAYDGKKVLGGARYSRETAERNIYDVAPDEKTAQAIIKEFFEPAHYNEAMSVRYQNKVRARVEKLGLSRKVESGNKISESAAVQLYGEAEDNVRILESRRGNGEKRSNGRTLAEWRKIYDTIWDENPTLNKAKILRAVKEFGYIYNEVFDMLNNVLMENGYEPMPFRSGYFPHFDGDVETGVLARLKRTVGLDGAVDPLPAFLNGKTYFANANERVGFDTKYDAVEGFDRYIKGACDVIFHTADIKKLRAFAGEIRYQSTDEGIRRQIDEILMDESYTEEEKESLIEGKYKDSKFALSNFVARLDEYTNHLANKKSIMDRNVEYMAGRGFYSVVKAVEGRFGANAVAANISAALSNIVAARQGFAAVSTADMIVGVAQTVSNGAKDLINFLNEKIGTKKPIFENDGFVERSTFLTNRRGTDRLVKRPSEILGDWGDKGFEIIDHFVTDSLTRARYRQNMRRGLSESTALSEADAWAASVVGDRSKGAMPILFENSNPLHKMITRFQLEANNRYSHLFKDMPRDLKDETLEKIALAYFKYFIGAKIINELFERVVGRETAFDPIGMLNDFAGDVSGYKLYDIREYVLDAIHGKFSLLKETEKKGVGKAGGNLAKEALEDMPFTALAGMFSDNFESGRMPVSGAMPNVGNIWNAATSPDIAGENKKQVVGKELAKPLFYLIPPLGGGQAKKTLEGAGAIKAGGSYTMNNKGEEILQYPIYSDSDGEKLRNYAGALIFGKSSAEGGREWVDSGFDSFSARETAAYKAAIEAGASARDAYDVIRSMGELKGSDGKSAGINEKALYLDKRNLHSKVKRAVYQEMIASDSEKEEITEKKLMKSMIESGADPGDLYLVLSGLRKLKADDKDSDEDDEPVKMEEKTGVLWRSRLSDKELAKIFSGVVSKGNYKKFTMAGMSASDAESVSWEIAKLVPVNGKKTVTDIQKARCVVDAGLSPAVEKKALESVMSKATFKKISYCEMYDVSAEQYIRLREYITSFDDNNNSVSQKDAKKGIEMLSNNAILPGNGAKGSKPMNLTRDQKAALFQMFNKAWEAKSNPYSVKIGREVKALLDEEKGED